jgi:hypothetical protein
LNADPCGSGSETLLATVALFIREGNRIGIGWRWDRKMKKKV